MHRERKRETENTKKKGLRTAACHEDACGAGAAGAGGCSSLFCGWMDGSLVDAVDAVHIYNACAAAAGPHGAHTSLQCVAAANTARGEPATVRHSTFRDEWRWRPYHQRCREGLSALAEPQATTLLIKWGVYMMLTLSECQWANERDGVCAVWWRQLAIGKWKGICILLCVAIMYIEEFK